MQGRLSPVIRNRIQAFPLNNWKKEFLKANEINLDLMEWTIDNYKLYKNPIMQKSELRKIKKLKKKYNLRIESITCDFLMENPFFKKKVKKFAESILFFFGKL